MTTFPFGEHDDLLDAAASRDGVPAEPPGAAGVVKDLIEPQRHRGHKESQRRRHEFVNDASAFCLTSAAALRPSSVYLCPLGEVLMLMQPITIRYAVPPGPPQPGHRRASPTCSASPTTSRRTSSPTTCLLDIRPGDLVLFTGPSGQRQVVAAASGRRATRRPSTPARWTCPTCRSSTPCRARWRSGLDRLAACGLSEARLLLRTPAELSDGQRYRFRLALRWRRASGGRQ